VVPFVFDRREVSEPGPRNGLQNPSMNWKTAIRAWVWDRKRCLLSSSHSSVAKKLSHITLSWASRRRSRSMAQGRRSCNGRCQYQRLLHIGAKADRVNRLIEQVWRTVLVAGSPTWLAPLLKRHDPQIPSGTVPLQQVSTERSGPLWKGRRVFPRRPFHARCQLGNRLGQQVAQGSCGCAIDGGNRHARAAGGR
jgi:hypothetical protein